MWPYCKITYMGICNMHPGRMLLSLLILSIPATDLELSNWLSGPARIWIRAPQGAWNLGTLQSSRALSKGAGEASPQMAQLPPQTAQLPLPPPPQSITLYKPKCPTSPPKTLLSYCGFVSPRHRFPGLCAGDWKLVVNL